MNDPIDDLTIDALKAGKSLDVFGNECPPGYRFLGWTCPRTEAERCVGCGSDDVFSSSCGHGVRGYRLATWRGFDSGIFRED